MKVEQQGVIQVNDFSGEREAKLLTFDLRSKRADVLGYASDGDTHEVHLYATESTLHKVDRFNDMDATVISFRYPNGYRISNAWVSRYTLTVVLAREPAEQGKEATP